MLEMQLPITELLLEWEKQDFITPLDRHFALQMAKIHHEDSALFVLLCTLLSHQLSRQHTCLPINQIDLTNPMAERVPSIQIKLNIDDLAQHITHFSAVGSATENKPLIFDQERLYLKRYYDYEARLASLLTQLSLNQYPIPAWLQPTLADLFPNNRHSQNVDWQKVAAALAFCRQFAVITGGPGTGKTTTVTKLLLLLCLNGETNIQLVAPTGKAAARLTESIKSSKQKLKESLARNSTFDLNAIEQIPEDASTIHRLLGSLPHNHSFIHHKNNPLHLDVLVLDEASMVDLPMMVKVIEAMPKKARLILLGDQDQLASVEAGAVLADICAGLKDNGDWQMQYSEAFHQILSELTQHQIPSKTHDSAELADSICMLRHSYRFRDDAGIGQLAKAVNLSQRHKIQQIWQSEFNELQWIEHQQDKTGLNQLLEICQLQYSDYLIAIRENQVSAIDIINKYNQFRVLCAVRQGEFGVEGLNQHIANKLKQAGLINTEQEFYLGRPIIIQSNDYNLGLFNGDIGLILLCNETQRPFAHFIQADGSILKVLPARLPTHETCYAITVHKSQGSEFDAVALALPENPSPSQMQLLTKELIYTAITRAKKSFTCLAKQVVFIRACVKPTTRASGLASKLWSNI